MEEAVPKMTRRRGSDARHSRRRRARFCRGCLQALHAEFSLLTALTSRRLNVVVRSPPLHPRGGPKWRDNYPDGSVRSPPNRLEIITSSSTLITPAKLRFSNILLKSVVTITEKILKLFDKVSEKFDLG